MTSTSSGPSPGRAPTFLVECLIAGAILLASVGIIWFGIVSLRSAKPEASKAQIAKTNADTSNLVVGSWQCKTEEGTHVISFLRDQSFSGKWATGSWGILTPTNILMSGTWSVDGTVLKYKVTQSSQDQMVGHVHMDTIIAINESVMVLRDDAAEEKHKLSTWVRQK